MRKSVKTLLASLVMVVLAVQNSAGQCAMCRATLENNVSNGQPGIAAGINIGIMYLFFAPYLAVGVLAYLWYRTSKKNALNFRKSNLVG